MLTVIVAYSLSKDEGILQIVDMLETMHNTEVIIIDTPDVSIEQVIRDLERRDMYLVPVEMERLGVVGMSDDKQIASYYNENLSRGSDKRIGRYKLP